MTDEAICHTEAQLVVCESDHSDVVGTRRVEFVDAGHRRKEGLLIVGKNGLHEIGIECEDTRPHGSGKQAGDTTFQ